MNATPPQPDEDAPLAHYVRMASIFAEMFSPVLETVVHDVSDPDHSIIAVYNGHVTERQVGDPSTDVVQKLVDGDIPDVIVGYKNEGPNGKMLKSTSVAIRDAGGELVGVMGLNLNVSYFDQFAKFMHQFTATEASEHVPEAEHFRTLAPERLDSPRADIRDAIDRYRTMNSLNARALSNREKRRVVQHLYEKGYFKARGAVTIMAELLGLTRPSVYKYKNDYIAEENGRA